MTVADNDEFPGRYRREELHARGGMSVVHTAHERGLSRRIALKSIPADFVDEFAWRKRFAREAEIASRLQHPNIVPVYGLSEDGTSYAMRFIDGPTLKAEAEQYHRAAKPDSKLPRRLIQSLIAACDAIAYAHGQGIAHRDLKPDNIMLGPFGDTLVFDWSLAVAFDPTRPNDVIPTRDEPAGNSPATHPADSSGTFTATGTRPTLPSGTPAYMSPEQVRGQFVPRSDVYALGRRCTTS